MTPANAVRGIRASVQFEDGRLRIWAFIDCDPTSVRRPQFAGPTRADRLWKTTCFEMFHTHGDHGYIEYNFSPSMQWAAYSFDSYRAGMLDFDVGADPPFSLFIDEMSYFDFSGSAPFGPERSVRIALSAIIEETDGTKSYWALRHPPGAPDFHHPDCFALTLEAPPPA